MKKCNYLMWLSLATLLLTSPVQAHDPEAGGPARTPDCAAMDSVDQTKMDMNDPIMQAMMQKCMKGAHDKMMHDDDEQATQEQDKQRKSKHEHQDYK